MNDKQPSELSLEEVEEIEKVTLRWLHRAALDFGMEAYEIFKNSPDEVKDVAEDVTRELLDRLPSNNLFQRIYGTVDYKRASAWTPKVNPLLMSNLPWVVCGLV